jgi:hypothetical protein
MNRDGILCSTREFHASCLLVALLNNGSRTHLRMKRFFVHVCELQGKQIFVSGGFFSRIRQGFDLFKGHQGDIMHRCMTSLNGRLQPFFGPRTFIFAGAWKFENDMWFSISVSAHG